YGDHRDLHSFPTRRSSDLANTVSLLASYIFTPHVQSVFFADGSSSGRPGRPGRPGLPADVTADLRAAFFRTANTILLRPLGDYQSGRATDAQYLAVKRLMPVFDRYAPAETVAALKAQFDKLGAVASNNARNRNDQLMRAGVEPVTAAERNDQPAQPDGQSDK